MALVGVWLLAGCSAPVGVAGTETETDTETGGSSSSSSGAASTFNPADTGDDGDDGVDDAPPPDTSADDNSDAPATDDASDAPATDDDDGCPPGTEGCPCDIGASCEGELLCDVASGTCLAIPECPQPEGEPNEAEDNAVELEELDCGEMAASFGALDGVDLDMFQYHAVDNIACFSQPQFSVTADVDLAACIFFSCDSGTADVQCPGGQDATDSPAGHPGCCGTNGAGFANRDCGFMNSDDGTVFMRLAQPKGTECIAYNIDYQM